MTRSVAIATFAGQPDYDDKPDSGDIHLVSALKRRGIKVSAKVWNDASVDWTTFDLVVIRSTWDYHLHWTEFIDWLNRLTTEKVNVANGAKFIKWNSKKTYLKDMEAKGIRIVPSEFVYDPSTSLEELMLRKKWNSAVIKPVIGADGHKLYKVPSPSGAEHFQEIFENMIRKYQGVIVQPYMETINTAGEWSLVFFGGQFSHAANKVPTEGYKTQELSPDSVVHTEEPPASILKAAQRVMKRLPEPPVYARVDMLIGDTVNDVLLSELEMIEPSLYLGMCKSASDRFAKAVIQAMQ